MTGWAALLTAALLLSTAGMQAAGQETLTTTGSEAPPKPTEQLPNVPVPVAGDYLFAPVAVGPDTMKIKAESYLVLTFGPRALVTPAFSAAIRMAHEPKGYPPDWCDGAPGYFRGYGSDLGNKFAAETGRYGAAMLLHEDFRYRPSGKKGVARFFYAIGYTFVDRSDSGHRTLAVSNFAGAAAGGFAGDLWLPDGFNSPGDGAKRFSTRLASMAGSNVAREFAPEIFSAAKGLHLTFLAPFLRVPIPEWWTKGLSVSRP